MNTKTIKFKDEDIITMMVEIADRHYTTTELSLVHAGGVVAGVIATLMAVYGCTLKEAVTIVRRIKPDIDPRCVPEPKAGR
jgi:uncharacterized protein YejL (UPF0352 family)